MTERATEAETTVRYTYRLSPIEGGVYAECVEVDAAGEGTTREEALESLRESLADKLGSTEAVAPPAHDREHHIELVEAMAVTPPTVGAPVA